VIPTCGRAPALSLQWAYVSRESGSLAPCNPPHFGGSHLNAPENLSEACLDFSGKSLSPSLSLFRKGRGGAQRRRGFHFNNRRSAFGASTASFSGLIRSSVVFSFFASIKSRFLRTKTGLQRVCALLSAGWGKKAPWTALQSSSERFKKQSQAQSPTPKVSSSGFPTLDFRPWPLDFHNREVFA